MSAFVISPLSPEEVPARLAALRKIPAAARELVTKVHRWLPVDGRNWMLAGSRESSPGALVFNTQLALEWALRLETPGGTAYAFAAFCGPGGEDESRWDFYLTWRELRLAPLPLTWNELHMALSAVQHNHFRLADHYGWRGALLGGPWTTPWDWPEVPAIAETLLQGLADAARHLDDVLGDCPRWSGTPAGQAVAPGGTRRRRCYERDHIWLSWHRAGLGIAAIRDRWNAEHPGDQIGKGASGREVVKKALSRARAEAGDG